MIPGLIWAGVILAWLIAEFVGLRAKRDSWPTFTDIVKRVRGDRSSPLWWILLGFWAWLFVHFFWEN